MKENVSIKYLELTDEPHQENDFPGIRSEVDANEYNDTVYKLLMKEKSTVNVPTYLKNIKLCKKFSVQLVLQESINKSDLKILQRYL